MSDRSETYEWTGKPENPAPRPPRRTRRLKSVENVRAFVASVLRQVEIGADPMRPLDPTRARVLLYGAQILAQLIQGAEFESRIAALESRAAAEARQ